MTSFRPKIMEATNANARMDALCEFIEFWIGPRQSSYGESVQALAEHSLPMPLKRLYEFAGRWPSWHHQWPMKDAVPAFSREDCLMALHRLKCERDGKVVFLYRAKRCGIVERSPMETTLLFGVTAAYLMKTQKSGSSERNSCAILFLAFL